MPGGPNTHIGGILIPCQLLTSINALTCSFLAGYPRSNVLCGPGIHPWHPLPLGHTKIKQNCSRLTLKANKKSLWFLVICRLQKGDTHLINFFGNLIFLKLYMYTVIGTKPNFPYGGSDWDHTNRANIHTPMWKSCLKHCAGIPINPAILAAIGHHFIARAMCLETYFQIINWLIII